MDFTALVGSHFARASNARAVSKGSGGDKASGPQPPSGDWSVRQQIKCAGAELGLGLSRGAGQPEKSD